MFTPIKPKSSGVLNDTVLSTPLPQATSTVRRKAILESKFNDNLQLNEEKSKQDLLYDNESTQKEDNSLGLLDNMSDLTSISTVEDEQKLNFSNIDAELEIARKLLQRCSDKNSVLITDTNKENNANMQNITSNMPVSNFILPIEACMSELDKECNMSHSVTFEPNEITARSSGVSSSAKRQSLINLSFHGISFNKNDIMTLNNEMMSEEFLSNSKGAEQLSMDQTCFAPHNFTYCMPGMKTEKQKIDFSTLSGIIGELDLSIESCAGRKVSVGRYFERKSDDIEMLGNGKAKPNLKVLETPIKTGKLPVLVESTVSIEATTSSMELTEKEHVLIPNITRDIDENSIISLSTIVNTLEDVNSETPRRLVDQLLMAQKKKNHSLMYNNARKENSDEKSILAMSIGNSNKFDDNVENRSAKLSIDSKTKNETINEIVNIKQERRSVSFPPNENVMKAESFTNISKKKMLEDSCNENVVSSINQDIENIVLGKNTEEACNCVVGLTNEVNVELINNGDRWITYIFKLIEVVGDTQSIELNIPSKEILINSNSTQSTKIEVKVLKMCKPIFVILNIFLSDMVAKSKWSMKHIIFVNPEQLELDIVCPSDKQNLDFQYIGEETIKILPITFYNKNNVAVPVKLSILEEGSKMFSIDGPTHFLLEPLKKFITNIKCEKSRSTSVDSPQRQPQHWKSKLIVYVQSKDDIILLKKEIPLYAQIGFCKIQIVDTEIPIVVPRQQGKSINIINSGNIAIHVFASIVPFEGHSNAMQDFFIKPDDIFLQVAERSSFLIVYNPQFSDANSVNNERYAKIKLVAGNNVYHYIISTEQRLLESEKENYLRCHTPNNVVSLSPATSPQSVTSNRSGPCDRNSPISTVSSSVVAGHVIPIRATHAALVWNSVKTGKSETKEFTIRNTSNNKIKIQIEICDDSKSFKFLGDKQTINTSLVLVMQRQEIKTLAVVFSPYSVGSVVGKITIKHYTRESSDSQQFKRIPLYGYGGCSKVKISGPFKDSSKKSWLSLGNLYSETMTLNASIRLDNIGDLRSFAKVTIIPKVISPIMDSSWHINPKEIILNSKESQEITIQFHPKKEDFASLQRSEVSHVATINVIYGDEPTRWRIRRLYNKLKQSGESIRNENEAFKNIVHPICKIFPGEQLIPGITLIRDSILNLNDLCTGVHQYEIMVTVEACADDTLPVQYDTDESEMYQSLISDTTHLDEAGGASFFASQTIEYEVQHPELQGDQFTVTPSTITLIPPVKNEATVTILSFFKTAEPFQTSLSNSDYFSVVPAEGMLPSKKSFPLKIQCSQKLDRNMQAVLAIYTENNKQDVLIKVKR
ncbi:PREDICTED: uncharacterized protein LOC105148070 isoform X2 [Acromyrmex echinatior]|uniref:Centrosomal protein of 192 kDa n=1 Tax=Acromyrmex echinatior TaxID=103372 RepID=F4WQY2_ACREC|nr:PREDICTED: uncharacterized protein LOC105148070 isoform X2 [Acromyrmex echinatior]EGI63495.1 Centrosomal protein of 192 kDa [Acromyrmex echinatior]